MVTILAFDSGPTESLLSSRNEKFFSEKFPIIYKTKIAKKDNPSKFYYNSAIDNALKNNQVKAVNLMIDYIVKYQNNLVSFYLFRYTLPTIIEKGISICPLLTSHIFQHTFDFDEWPTNHPDPSYQIRPYCKTFFNIRNYYNQIFPEKQFSNPDDFDDSNIKDEGNMCINAVEKIKNKSERVYKIKYTINMLSQIEEHVIDNLET